MPYRMAVTIAGAVSLGSFEAGVLFELFDALGQHNRAVAEHDRIYVDVMTGASAGGMTAAIAAQNLLYTSQNLGGPYDNAFYKAWVADVDINGLLPLRPSENPTHSILSSDFVGGIAQNLLLSRYRPSPVPPPSPHPAVNPQQTNIQLGLALSNLNGVDYARGILSGGTFNYTRFQDQIVFDLNQAADTKAVWDTIQQSARACGAFPFAFRPLRLSRNKADFASPFLAPFPHDPRDFIYTDGGVFQNQPLGMAKNIVDRIDHHRDTERRSFFFVSPDPLDPTINGITQDSATFLVVLQALVNAIYSQAGFRDWIEAETVNQAVELLNHRARQLYDRLKNGAVNAAALQPAADALLPQFGLDANELAAARDQLREQFKGDYLSLQTAQGQSAADTWIDSLLVLELAADLHEKDEMYIYSVTASKRELAGSGLFSFFGFLSREFRDHDYDVGRQKTQGLLANLAQASGGRLPRLSYVPQPIRPITATPREGFTPAMIPKANRQALLKALSGSIDRLLEEIGVAWLVRKSVEFTYINRKLKALLGL